MAVLFLTMAFLSQSWGKHLLVETEDANDGLDTNTVDAETLIYTLFKDEELDGFEKLSAKKQKKIIKDINKIIKNVNIGRNMDFNMGVMEEIEEIVGGEERVIDGLKSLIKLMPGGGKDYHDWSFILNVYRDFFKNRDGQILV